MAYMKIFVLKLVFFIVQFTRTLLHNNIVASINLCALKFLIVVVSIDGNKREGSI